VSQAPNQLAAQSVVARNRRPSRTPVDPSLRVRREMGKMPRRTGAHRSGLVMESDGDRHSKRLESRISPERLQNFREVYLSHGCNAVRTAIAIGVKPTSAKANAHRLARAVKLEMQEALDAIGMDTVAVAKKLAELLEAKKRIWNREEQKWDVFPDTTVQLEAVKEINRLLNTYPAPKPDIEPTTVTVVIDPTML
jgi:hypothetical protein